MSKGIHGRAFFQRWQMLYAATNPGHRKDSWEVDGVQWVKEKNAHWSEHYSVSTEIHRLTHRGNAGRDEKSNWQLMVVIEQWWGPDRDKAIRYTSWLKIISGKPDQILKWMKAQEAETSPRPAPTTQS